MTQPVHACRLTSAALAALILAACDTSTIEDDGFVIDEAPRAVVTTQADDFTSGAHALVDIEAPYTTTGNLDAGESDISVTTAGEHLYKLRRFNLDTITKYSLDAPAPRSGSSRRWTPTTRPPPIPTTWSSPQPTRPICCVTASRMRGLLTPA